MRIIHASASYRAKASWWQALAIGTVATRLPPSVRLNSTHSVAVGQQRSPGKQRHNELLFDRDESAGLDENSRLKEDDEAAMT